MFSHCFCTTLCIAFTVFTAPGHRLAHTSVSFLLPPQASLSFPSCDFHVDFSRLSSHHHFCEFPLDLSVTLPPLLFLHVSFFLFFFVVVPLISPPNIGLFEHNFYSHFLVTLNISLLFLLDIYIINKEDACE